MNKNQLASKLLFGGGIAELLVAILHFLMPQEERAAWVFGLSQGILWTARIVSELVLPVKIPLFFLSNPTTVILPLVIVIALLFLVPTLILWPGRQGKAVHR